MSDAASELLRRSAEQPCALLVEGEAGIGKTTAWLDVVAQARDTNFQILSTQSAAVEAVLAYTSLADLLADTDPTTWSRLPEPQRRGIDAMLLRSTPNSPTDQRAVAAGFVAIVEELARNRPVLLAIDDLQWLDSSSRAALAFAVRRFSGRVATLGTFRVQVPDHDAAWFQPSRPDALLRIRLQPMSIGELHGVLAQRLGRNFSRPTIIRIHERSGGNPWYAIELARVLADHDVRENVSLPDTLAAAVRARISSVSNDVQDMLLATACCAEPTTDLLADALDLDAEVVVERLEEAEDAGIVACEGIHVRFSHPLLAHGIYTESTAAQRRDMHRRMAEIIDQTELRARHLALAAVKSDAATIDALDAGAQMARTRGAPSAAAELLDLAIELGGDTPERRIESARHHFDAGDPARAGALLDDTARRLPRGVTRARAVHLLAVVRLLTDSFLSAATLLEDALTEAASDYALTVQMLIALAFSLLNAGRLDAALDRAEQAASEAETLGEAQLISQALTMRTMMRFLRGEGVDDAAVQRALSLEDPHAKASVAFRASAHTALLLAFTGELERADVAMASVKQRAIDQGEDGQLMFVLLHNALLGVWRGDFRQAAVIADETMELAQQLDGDLPLCIGHTVRGAVAAYTGREDVARHAAREAQAAARRSNALRLIEWPTTISGFLDTSLGNWASAAATLTPLMAFVQAVPNNTEIISASYMPDLAECFVRLGRLDEAEFLVDALERNGRRLDRAWMLAVGGRCRAMLWASRGDLGAALDAAEQAINEHDRLPMPFERARTQILLGQIQHRHRRKAVAVAILCDAADTFESLGTPLWAQRARAELSRIERDSLTIGDLTRAERQVAELAATGITLREIAATLFISRKTAETHLGHIYRKLGIHSRAELVRRFDQHPP